MYFRHRLAVAMLKHLAFCKCFLISLKHPVHFSPFLASTLIDSEDGSLVVGGCGRGDGQRDRYREVQRERVWNTVAMNLV